MTSPGYGTPFIESEIVLAADAGDWDEVRNLLGSMTTNEIAAFADLLSQIDAEVSGQQNIAEQEGRT